MIQKRQLPISFKATLILLIGTVLLITFAFSAQDRLLSGDGDWFRIPIAPWQASSAFTTTIYWHVLGTLGYFLFSSRFWLQWWIAEKAQESQLPISFWWISLIGALLSITYFMHIGDIVNLLGPLFGVIPYTRNLMLIQKNIKALQKT